MAASCPVRCWIDPHPRVRTGLLRTPCPLPLAPRLRRWQPARSIRRNFLENPAADRETARESHAAALDHLRTGRLGWQRRPDHGRAGKEATRFAPTLATAARARDRRGP